MAPVRRRLANLHQTSAASDLWIGINAAMLSDYLDSSADSFPFQSLVSAPLPISGLSSSGQNQRAERERKAYPVEQNTRRQTVLAGPRAGMNWYAELLVPCPEHMRLAGVCDRKRQGYIYIRFNEGKVGISKQRYEELVKEGYTALTDALKEMGRHTMHCAVCKAADQGETGTEIPIAQKI